MAGEQYHGWLSPGGMFYPTEHWDRTVPTGQNTSAAERDGWMFITNGCPILPLGRHCPGLSQSQVNWLKRHYEALDTGYDYGDFLSLLDRARRAGVIV